MYLPGFLRANPVKSVLSMSREELNRLNDHDLLLLLHERLGAHVDEHRRNTVALRWTIIAILTGAGVIVASASVVASFNS